VALESNPAAISGTYVPVSGLTDTNGSLLALQGLVSDPTLLVPPDTPWTQFASNAVQITPILGTAEMMASIGFKGLSLSGQSNVVYWVLEILATNTVPSSNPDSPIATWVFGVGLRAGVRGVSVEGNAALSLQNLAASATLNGTSTSFQFDTIGVGAAIMPALKGLVDQSLTGFDVSTWQEIGNVIDDLTAFIANPANAGQLTPQVVGVIFATNYVLQGPAATYGWALRGIQQEMSATTLNEKTPTNLPYGVAVDYDIITNVYNDIVNSQTATPTDGEKDTAWSLTHSGP